MADDDIGLRGAKAAGDRRVSTLLSFSWAELRASRLAGVASAKIPADRVARVISGGQTGADMAGLRAARLCGIPTGGTAPLDYNTELGPRIRLLRSFGLEEHRSKDYPPRTAKNIRDSHLTLVIAEKLDSGSGLTIRMCRRQGRPFLHVRPSSLEDAGVAKAVRAWVLDHLDGATVVNVAGNRESKSPGIERAATRFLVRLLKGLPHESVPKRSV